MPHISKKSLDKKFVNKLYSELLQIIEKSAENKLLEKVTGELLTRTEKIMLAKRLASVVMLSKDVPHHVIVETLNVSPSTVARISLSFEIGEYKHLLRQLQEDNDDVFDLLEKVLLMGMPPYGRRRKKKI